MLELENDKKTEIDENCETTKPIIDNLITAFEKAIIKVREW